MNCLTKAVCGFVRSSSIQARYHWTLVFEGNTVEEMVRCLAYVGRSNESGRTIRITRRIFAKSMLIQVYDCVVHYERRLKTERYVSVQVVLLFTLLLVYQDF